MTMTGNIMKDIKIISSSKMCSRLSFLMTFFMILMNDRDEICFVDFDVKMKSKI